MFVQAGDVCHVVVFTEIAHSVGYLKKNCYRPTGRPHYYALALGGILE